MVFIHLFVSIQVTGDCLARSDAGSGYNASRVVAPDGASPAERRVMHVATPAAGGNLDCSFDRIHNLIISYV